MHQFIDGAFAPMHLTFFNVNIYHTADSILIFFVVLPLEIVPHNLNFIFMISFSFSEIQDLRSKCWSGNLSDSDFKRLAELCTFSLHNVPFKVFTD